MNSGRRAGAFGRGSPLFEFRAFLGARLTDGLGWTAITTVVGYQLWILTGDPLSLAWLGLVQAIPSISLSLFGGHLADRRDRRAIILAATALLTLSALSLPASRAVSCRRPWALSRRR
jgi:MFS family permease